jgi:hypothetical protein
MNEYIPLQDMIHLHLSGLLGRRPVSASEFVRRRITHPVLAERLPAWHMGRRIAVSLRNQLELQCGYDDRGLPLLNQYQCILITELEVSRFGLYHLTRATFDLS